MGWSKILAHQSKWSPDRPLQHRLTVEDAIILYRDAPLHQLLKAAHRRRMLMHPDGCVTYLIDRNINYTNVCTINCQFCSFYRPPGHDENYTQTYEQISARISELEEIGGVRILMQGGVNPDLPLEWYTNLLKFLKDKHPKIDLDCFSPIEIQGIAKVCDKTTLDVLIQLKKAGMHGLPGGGAEMLVDSIRDDVSPKKGGPQGWLRVMREAMELGLTTSATNVIGFGETLEQRIEHLVSIRDLQDEINSKSLVGFTSFIAWPVQLEVNSFGKRNRGQNKFELGTGSSEYLRHVAISRLFLDNIEHIQASWPTMGMKISQIALLSGADDAGSTMMEENVVSASGTTKTLATETELQSLIVRAGFVPKRRNSDYELFDTRLLVKHPHNLASALPTLIPEL